MAQKKQMQKRKGLQAKQGFTIIEVVLVLAIAGLIFLMVFVALPALQRSQRDTQRRNDMARVDTALTQYLTNHNGANLPQPSGEWNASANGVDANGDGNFEGCNNSACAFVRDYMNAQAVAEENQVNDFKDPGGTLYNLQIVNANNASFVYDNSNVAFNEYLITIVTGAKCDGENAVKSTERHYAVVYRLEGSGTYCIDDQ